jgi:hypothetical protein
MSCASAYARLQGTESRPPDRCGQPARLTHPVTAQAGGHVKAGAQRSANGAERHTECAAGRRGRRNAANLLAWRDAGPWRALSSVQLGERARH